MCIYRRGYGVKKDLMEILSNDAIAGLSYGTEEVEHTRQVSIRDKFTPPLDTPWIRTHFEALQAVLSVTHELRTRLILNGFFNRDMLVIMEIFTLMFPRVTESETRQHVVSPTEV